MQSAVFGRIALNAKALKELRKINGVSQERLAEECLKRKIPVSVASIKRAEAGKNVLYRTITNLACYFDIPVDQLLDDAPLSLWQYTKDKSKQYLPCFGRDFELLQLHSFYNQTLQSKHSEPVYIYGLPGIGKSYLINTFLNQIKITDQHIIRFNIESQFTDYRITAREFMCRLLGVAVMANDGVIRHRINEIFTSPTLCLHIMQIAGVSLLQAEQKTLKRLTNKNRDIYNKDAFQQLLNYLIARDQTMMIIENLQNADSDLRALIEVFSIECHNHCFFLLLCACDIRHFASPPPWLQNARSIHLQALKEDAIQCIINYQWEALGQKPKQLLRLKEYLTNGSEGHPGLLIHQLQNLPDQTAMLLSKNTAEMTFTESGNEVMQANKAFSHCVQTSGLYQWAKETIKTFSQEQKRLLSFLALSEFAFDIRLVGFFVENSNTQDTFYFLHQYITLGLLRSVSDKYCFRHKVIRQTVLDQTSHKEQSILSRLWKKYQVSRK